MRRRRLACGRVRCREGGRPLERQRELCLVERVDEDPGLLRDEFRRSAETGRDDRAAAGHRLEDGLAERLEQARRADDVGRCEVTGDLGVRDAAREPDARPSFQPRPQRALALGALGLLMAMVALVLVLVGLAT